MKTLYRRIYMVVVLAALLAGAWLVDSPVPRLVLAILAGGLTFALIYSRSVALDSLARTLDNERTQTQILELLLRGNLTAFQDNMELALRTAAASTGASAGFLCRLRSGCDPELLAWSAGADGPAAAPAAVTAAVSEAAARLARDEVVEHDGPERMLLVPIDDNDERWGAIGLYGRRDRRSWAAQEIKLLRMVAGMMRAAYGRHRAESATQAALDQAHASSRAKSQFLANMSHEIRTPLNCIVGLSDHLHDLHPTSEQVQCLDLVRHSSDMLLQIINNVLDLSRIEAGGIVIADEQIDLPRMLTNSLGMFATRADDHELTLDLDVPDDLPNHVRGDDARLGQILTNLLGNAVKFTQDGGICLAVTVGAPRAEGGPPCFRFDVTDSGIGIAQDKLDQIFENFTQADASTTRLYGGTGLGLAISRSLAELMGGSLTAASLEGRGSVFTLELPLELAEATPEVAAPSTPAPDTTPASFPGRRVLVVEDNRLNQMVARKMLVSLGCEVEVAENGNVALDLVTWQEFDLVLMDYMMPGLDGPETTRCLRRLDGWAADVCVVALTANALDTHQATCLEAGMNGFLTKPIRKRDLVKILASLPETAPIS